MSSWPRCAATNRTGDAVGHGDVRRVGGEQSAPCGVQAPQLEERQRRKIEDVAKGIFQIALSEFEMSAQLRNAQIHRLAMAQELERASQVAMARQAA